MKIQDRDQNMEVQGFKINNKLFLKLTLGGCIIFWLTSIITSLLPLAAEYRAAFSNWSIQSVWMGSLFMGIILGGSITYFLLRFYAKIPAKNPILTSVILSFIALVFALLLLDVPMYFQATAPSLFYLFIGILFNTVRFLFLGIGIGYLYRKN